MWTKLWNWIKNLFSSGSTPKPVPTPKPRPTLPPNGLLIGYGNIWPSSWPQMHFGDLADRMQENGLNFTQIELDELGTVDKAVEFVNTMRKRGITTQIVQENGNAPVVKKPVQYFKDKFDDLKRKLGSADLVVYQPISEAGEAGDKDRVMACIDYALDNWFAGGQTCLSAKFKWSQPFLSRVTYHEWHFCVDPTAANMFKGKKYIVNTDCGKSLGLGHNEKRIRAAVQGAIKNNCHFLLYDGRVNDPRISYESIFYLGMDF